MLPIDGAKYEYDFLLFFAIVMGILVIYPTATMAQELHKGIMSKDTYGTREEFIDFEKVEKAGIPKTYITNFHAHFGSYLGTTPEPTTK